VRAFVAQREPGTVFPAKISHALEASNFLGLVLTRGALKRRWVEQEWTAFTADRRPDRIIPIQRHRMKAPAILRGLEPVDATDGDTERAATEIATRVKQRTAWEHYKNVLDIDGYKVAYIPLLNDCRRRIGTYRIRDVDFTTDSNPIQLASEFQNTSIEEVFADDPSCGLASYHPLKGGLTLAFAETSYGDYLRSGEHLDDPLPSDSTRTFRDEFGQLVTKGVTDFRRLERFQLTNICGVGVFVVTKDGHIVVTRHSERSHVYPGRFTFSASGTMKWGAYPHPFTEVLRKAFDEIRHQIDPDKLRLVSFGADARKLFFDFGFTEQTEDKLRDVRKRCPANVQAHDIPFDGPERIVEHLRDNCWEPAAEATLLTMCAREWGYEGLRRALGQHRSAWQRRVMRDEWDDRASRPGLLPNMSVRYPPGKRAAASRRYEDKVMIFMGQDVAGRDVLEVGGGTGRLTRHLVAQSDLTCIDLCDRMIQRNKNTLGKAAEKVRYQNEFAQDYFKRKRHHDVAVCSLVLIHNVSEAEYVDLVRGMCGCVDTVFVFEDVTVDRPTSPHTHLRSEQRLTTDFARHGFAVQRRGKIRLFGDKIIMLKFVRKTSRGGSA